jgi:hypothetical protein
VSRLLTHSVNRSNPSTEADGEARGTSKVASQHTGALLSSLEASAPRCMGQRLWKL